MVGYERGGDRTTSEYDTLTTYDGRLVSYALKFWQLSGFEGLPPTPEEIARYDQRWLDDLFRVYDRLAYWKEEKEAREAAIREATQSLKQLMNGKRR